MPTEVNNQIRTWGCENTAVSTKHPVILSLEWILANRTNPATLQPWNPSSLSLAARMSRPHLARILNGDQKNPNLTRRAAIGYARAGDVRMSWLLTHEGDPGRFEGGDAAVAGTQKSAGPAGAVRRVADMVIATTTDPEQLKLVRAAAAQLEAHSYAAEPTFDEALADFGAYLEEAQRAATAVKRRFAG